MNCMVTLRLDFFQAIFQMQPKWLVLHILFVCSIFFLFNIDEFNLRMNSHVNDLKTVSKLILICDCLLLMHFYNSVHSVVDIVVVYLFIYFVYRESCTFHLAGTIDVHVVLHEFVNELLISTVI